MSIKVNISNRQREIKLPQDTRSLVRRACTAAISEERFKDDCEINVTFVDDAQIQKINSEFRSIDKATDVLSFPMGENGEYEVNPESGFCILGDVIISTEHAFAQADLYGHGIEREIAYLTVHSVLHLLGYDHVNSEDERRLMRSREEIILKALGLEIKGEN